MDRDFADAVIDWYQNNRRSIPWREDPSPYHTWLSEIMCQQTRIETVIPYYLNFIEEVPDIESLSELSEDRLMKLWQGLGYYSRARNLQKAAQVIVTRHHGVFPGSYEEVLALPGIGTYTAGAILSMAFQQNYAAVDGNVLRILTRCNADIDDISLEATKKKYKAEIEALPKDRPGDFNQGLMDIGATICIPNGEPLCSRCPLKEKCLAHLRQIETQFPVKAPRSVRKEENYTVFLIFQNGKILLRKRSGRGLLANLYEFKNVPGFLSPEEVRLNFPEARISSGKQLDFVFTHKTWHMKSYVLTTENYLPEEGELLVTPEELSGRYSIPTAFAQFLDLPLNAEPQSPAP